MADALRFDRQPCSSNTGQPALSGISRLRYKDNKSLGLTKLHNVTIYYYGSWDLNTKTPGGASLNTAPFNFA